MGTGRVSAPPFDESSCAIAAGADPAKIKVAVASARSGFIRPLNVNLNLTTPLTSSWKIASNSFGTGLEIGFELVLGIGSGPATDPVLAIDPVTALAAISVLLAPANPSPSKSDSRETVYSEQDLPSRLPERCRRDSPRPFEDRKARPRLRLCCHNRDRC